MIPNGGQNYVRNQFQMDATTSTIFLKLVGRTKHLGDFVVYTAGNFRGGARSSSSRTPMCLSLVSRWVTIIVPSWIWAALPPSIDYAGPAGQVFSRATLLRYERAFGKGWKAGCRYRDASGGWHHEPRQ